MLRLRVSNFINYKLFFLSMLVLLSMGSTPFANAHNCVVSGGTFTLTATNIMVDSTSPPGTKIGAPITGNTTRLLTCTDTSGISSQALIVNSLGTSIGGVIEYDDRIIYPTGIPGIGFAFGAYSAECNKTAWGVTSSGTTTAFVCKNYSGPIANNLTYIPQIQLYKTSYRITPSIVNSKIVGAVQSQINNLLYSNNGSSGGTYYLSISAKQQTCQVTTPNIPVNLGKVRIGEFTGALSTAKSVPFNIGINCSTTTNLSVQIDSISYANSNLGVMNISDVSKKATGVGVQILDGSGNVFRLNTANSIGTNNGIFNIPFSARYIQIDNNITSGVANAAATFTIKYN